MTSTTGPDYRKVIDLIRDRITSGEWPVGARIPSTPELRKLTGLSVTSVRRAVEQLQADGVLVGHPGKGVYVTALPEDADRERADAEALGKRIEEVAGRVAGYADLRAWVAELEANLMELYSRLGQDYPHGGEHDSAQEPPKRQAGR